MTSCKIGRRTRRSTIRNNRNWSNLNNHLTSPHRARNCRRKFPVLIMSIILDNIISIKCDRQLSIIQLLMRSDLLVMRVVRLDEWIYYRLLVNRLSRMRRACGDLGKSKFVQILKCYKRDFFLKSESCSVQSFSKDVRGRKMRCKMMPSNDFNTLFDF